MNGKKDMLDFIFEAKSDEIAYITEKYKQFLDSKKINIDKQYSNFKKSY